MFSGHLPRRHVPRQLGLITVLLLTFAFELGCGIDLIVNPHSNEAAEIVCNMLVALLIIGLARAWELVGDRATGIITSLAVLAGHEPNPGGVLQGVPAGDHPRHDAGTGGPVGPDGPVGTGGAGGEAAAAVATSRG